VASPWDAGASSNTDAAPQQEAGATHAPTDERLLYISMSTGGIVSAFTDGTDPQPISPSGWNCTDMAWSPDGKQIVFVSNGGTDAVLSVIDADGSGLDTLATTSAILDEVSSPTWAPDGTILFVSTAVFTYEGTSTTTFTPYQISVAHPFAEPAALDGDAAVVAFSPDGTEVAYTTADDGLADAYLASPPPTGSSEALAIPGQFSWLSPAWVPGGKTLVFAATPWDEYAAPGLWQVSADPSSTASLVTTLPGRTGQPSVARDGVTAAVEVWNDYDADIMTVSLDAKTVATLVPHAVAPRYQP
jgi:Tol biopolymer transport system component